MSPVILLSWSVIILAFAALVLAAGYVANSRRRAELEAEADRAWQTERRERSQQQLNREADERVAHQDRLQLVVQAIIPLLERWIRHITGAASNVRPM